MKKVLITGASGFIGKSVADYLSRQPGIEVVRYSRYPKPGYFSCQPGDDAWLKIVDECTAIINCAGVGLAKIKRQRNANEAIARELVASLPLKSDKKYRLLHLSTIKAYNARGYDDAYADDKQRAETVFLDNSDRLRGELLRIPAVFGTNDANLNPLLKLAKKGKLPEIEGDISNWFCISNEQIACYIHRWLEEENQQQLRCSYLLSRARYSVNDLIKAVNRHIHGDAYRAGRKKLFQIRMLYRILALKSRLAAGFRWNQFPAERFQDLFQRSWEIEQSENIALHLVNFAPDDIWKGK